MKIYIAHSRKFDFRKELYELIKNSSFFKEHAFIFPHEKTDELFNSKEFFQNGCDLVIAEVSYPSIGLGIELGWANMMKIPIISLYKKGFKISESLHFVSDKVLEYSSTNDLLEKIRETIRMSVCPEISG